MAEHQWVSGVFNPYFKALQSHLYLDFGGPIGRRNLLLARSEDSGEISEVSRVVQEDDRFRNNWFWGCHFFEPRWIGFPRKNWQVHSQKLHLWSMYGTEAPIKFQAKYSFCFSIFSRAVFPRKNMKGMNPVCWMHELVQSYLGKIWKLCSEKELLS